MSGDLVVGVDSSTTAVKAIAWNAAGEAVAEGRASLTLDNPSPGAWEQDAEAWWSAFVVACASLTEQLDPSRLCALGITHQRETVVVTDGAGRPRAPALTWMDARATAQVDAARAALGAEQLLAISGKPACTTPSFYKLAWLFETRPELARGERRVLDVHGFLCWRLTGRCATSLAAADPLGLVDMQARAWSASLAAHLGLALGELAELVEPGTVIGGVSEAAARATGLPAGLPVVAGAGDGQCAGLGAGIRAPGRAYLNLGTAIVSGVLGESYRTSTAFRTLYDATGAHYFFETDLQGGTFTITWLVDRWLRRRDPRPFDEVLAELSEEAAALPPGADGLLLLPYLNGVMNPYWDDRATGAVIGLRGDHGPAHLFRAILEGIALEQRKHLRGVEEALGAPIEEVVVMGGGSRSDLWCQILADVLNRPLRRAKTTEATALGAGILTAVAAGLHPDLSTAVAAMTGLGEAFAPGPRVGFYDRLYNQAFAELYERLAPSMAALWELRREAKVPSPAGPGILDP